MATSFFDRFKPTILQRAGSDHYWGTAGAPTFGPMQGSRAENDYWFDLAEGSSPETFMRDGREYSRGFGQGAFSANPMNEWLNQYILRDAEFGDALPTDLISQIRSESDIFEKMGPAIAALPLVAGAIPASLNALGGVANSFQLPVGFTAADADALATQLFGGLESASGVAGWSETLPNTFSESALGDMAFDPMADYAEYLSGNYGTPSAVAPGVSEATGGVWPSLFPGGFSMPMPTTAPFPAGGGNETPRPGTTTDPDWTKIPLGTAGGLLGGLGGLLSGAGSLVSTQGPMDWMKLLGTGLSTALGMYGANQQANSLERIANQARADRQPFLDDALDMLRNPGKFYERPEVMGSIDASLRGLSSKVGNPINNPGAIAQQAAYNLGTYNNALSSRANLGLAGQDLTSKLQTNAALANNNIYNALGSGLGSMLSTAPNMNNVLFDYLSRQM